MSEQGKTKTPVHKRRMARRSSQADLISQFQSGVGGSEKSRAMLDGMKKRDEEKTTIVHKEPLFKTPSETDRILVDYIQPQKDNPRYLPVVFADEPTPEAIAALTDCVVCEKDILENRLKPSDPRYAQVEDEIKEILALAETLRHNEMIHPIVVWRKNMTDYPIVAGHRRLYAVRYLYGGMVKIKTKIYPTRPANLNVLRHIENFSRSDLAPADAMRSYRNAVEEITNTMGDSLESNRHQTISSHLGIGVSTYYRYEKLSEYYDLVAPLLERRIASSLVSLHEEISLAEKQGRDAVIGYLDGMLKNNKYSQFSAPPEPEPPRKRASAKKYISLPKIKISQTSALRRLLTEDVTKMDTGIDWDSVDLDSPEELEEVIKAVLTTLTSD